MAAPPSLPLPRALTILVGTASAVIVAAGVQAASWLIDPVFLALVIVIAVHPVHDRLRRWGLPPWAATLALLLLAYGVLLVLAGVVVVSVARLATILPTYAGHANELLRSVTAALGRFGVGADQLRALSGEASYARLLGFIGALLLGVTSLAGNLVFLLTLLLFLIIESTGAPARMMALAEDRAPIAAALGRFTSGTRRFLGITSVVGLVTGLVDTLALFALGVPLAVLWGLLAFITNYIPYVGFFIGLLPPALLALLGGGWQLLVLVVVIYIAVNFVLTSLVQPRFVGDSVGLSVTVTLVALVFWGWLLGPLGALLAIPLTLLVKAVLIDVDPRAAWTETLLASAHTTRPRWARPRDPL